MRMRSGAPALIASTMREEAVAHPKARTRPRMAERMRARRVPLGTGCEAGEGATNSGELDDTLMPGPWVAGIGEGDGAMLPG